MKKTMFSRMVFALLFTLFSTPVKSAEETIYSGPQKGEKTTSFAVKQLVGDTAGQERTINPEGSDKPTMLVFVQGLERSMTPLLNVLDEYGTRQREKLNTEFVFLSSDALASEQRLPLVRQSLGLQSPISLSIDGAEGPGNYGLNRECLMTIIITIDGLATGNFALVQPGIADGNRILENVAGLIGDTAPPDAETLLSERRDARGNARPAAQRENPSMSDERPVDRPAQRDAPASTEADTRQRIERLSTEVHTLRTELERLRQNTRRIEELNAEIRSLRAEVERLRQNAR